MAFGLATNQNFQKGADCIEERLYTSHLARVSFRKTDFKIGIIHRYTQNSSHSEEFFKTSFFEE